MKLTLVSFLFFVTTSVFSQNSFKTDNNPDNLKDERYKLIAENNAPISIRLPFTSIKISDDRFDTSKIGFIYSGGILASKKKLFSKIKFNGGVAKAIENYYKDYYASSFTNNGFELLISIKKLWISNFNSKTHNDFDITKRAANDGAAFLLKWEYYIGKGGYYLPVKRVDTAFDYLEAIQKNRENFKKEKEWSDLKFFLQMFIEKYDFEKGINAFATAPKKTFEQIEAYNKRRFDIPVIKDSSFVTGVYLNFDEFKLNRPSITVFTEKKMSFGTLKKEEYLEDADGNPINKYWGYSTMTATKFGRYGHEKVFRVNNTFEFFSKIRSQFTSTNPGGIPATTTTNSEEWVPVQIDMETGEIY